MGKPSDVADAIEEIDKKTKSRRIRSPAEEKGRPVGRRRTSPEDGEDAKEGRKRLAAGEKRSRSRREPAREIREEETKLRRRGSPVEAAAASADHKESAAK